MAVYERVSIGSLAQGAVPPGYTFTRSTAALYVDSDGLLKWSAHNLLTYSEDWSNAAWVKSGSTINANAATAPDGTTTADEFVETADSSAHQLGHAASVGARVYTYSCYVKKRATRHWVRLMVYDGGATFTAAYFDLDTGLTGTVDSPATASMESVGDGWYRCTMVLNGTFGNVYIHGATADGGADTYAGSTSEGFYLWGAQLNYGSTATAYLPTTSAARYDSPRRQWDATNRRWGYVGEGSRTNLATYSEDLTNAAWTKTDCTVTANSATSPDGTANADTLNSTVAGGRAIGFAVATATSSHAISVFVKAGTASSVTILLRNNTTATNLAEANFSLASGASSALTGAGAVAFEGENVGNGWWRIAVASSGGVTAGNSLALYVYPATSSGTGTSYAWGAQLEAGPYPTSYIPTTTVAVSRGADLLTRALTAGEGTALSAQGTMVVEYGWLGGGSAADASSRIVFAIDDGTVSNRNIIYNGGGLTGQTATSTVAQGTINHSTAANVGELLKAAYTWSSSPRMNLAIGGAAKTADTTAPDGMPVVNKVSVGSRGTGGSIFGGLIYGWTIYDDAKTDAELQALSSPTVSRNSGSLRLGLGLGL